VIAEYAFRISGRIPPALTARAPLKGVQTSVDTLLVGPLTDRAALRGYLVETVGLYLVDLRLLPAGDDGRHCCLARGRAEVGTLLATRGGGAVALIEPAIRSRTSRWTRHTAAATRRARP